MSRGTLGKGPLHSAVLDGLLSGGPQDHWGPAYGWRIDRASMYHAATGLRLRLGEWAFEGMVLCRDGLEGLVQTHRGDCVLSDCDLAMDSLSAGKTPSFKLRHYPILFVSLPISTGRACLFFRRIPSVQ